MKIAIIINSTRLTEALKEKLQSSELRDKYNIDYDLFFPEPENLATILNQVKTQSYNAFLIGGGDGTVRTAIQYLAETAKPIAIFPLGTFNVLAKTLIHSEDIDALFAMIKNNKTKQIDLIDVNGLIIANHAWIGLYYRILKLRKKYKNSLGRNKILKILFTTIFIFIKFPIYTLYIKNENEETIHKTCLVYIGNNEFQHNLLDLGNRKTMSSGIMSMIILNCRSRWEIVLCIFSLIFSTVKNSPYVTQLNTDNLKIDSNSKMINIVLDGELFKLENPLNFKILPKFLTVYVP